MGERALKARKICNDTEPLQKLMQASEGVPALPGPPPPLAIEDKPGRVQCETTRCVEPLHLWLEVCKRLRVEDNVRLLAVSKGFRNAVRGHYGKNCLYDDYVQQVSEQRRGPQILRFGLFTRPLEDEDSSEDKEDDALGGSFPRTGFTWGGTFAIYQNQKPGNHDLLEALKREADEDMDFATFLYKYLYAVKQVTPPCPQLDPQLLTEAKELWGLHTGKRAVEALTAEEEDT